MITLPYASTHERPYGGSVSRLQPNHVRSAVNSPEMGVEYNKSKAFVDAVDAKALGTGSLEMAMTSHKWWHVGYFGLFDCTTVRVEVLCKALGLYQNRLECLQNLHSELVNNKIDLPVANATRGSVEEAREQLQHTTRFKGRHQIEVHKEWKGAGTTRHEVNVQADCVVCRAGNYGKTEMKRRHKGGPPVQTKKRAPRPIYQCSTCKVHLCVDGCMEAYHGGLIEHLDYGKIRKPKDGSI